MPIKILMPAMSPTMTEGNLVRWLKKVGEAVKSGDTLAEVETDKATMEVEAVDDGQLGRILIPDGTQAVAVNTPIALLLTEGEEPSVLAASGAGVVVSSTAVPAPPIATQPGPPQPIIPAKAIPPSGRSDGGGPRVPSSSLAGRRILASPLARRLAAEAGIDIATITGSGPRGRIVRADVEQARISPPIPAQQAVAPPPPVPVVKPAASDPLNARELADRLGLRYTPQPNTSMRKTIARRLSQAKQTIPHFYLSLDCSVDRLLQVRKELNDRSPTEGPGSYKLSVNDFIIKAAAVALRRVPAANAAWTDEATLLFDDADISVAVATPGGLITPIIKAAQGKGLTQISQEMRDLASRARAGKLKPEEYQGGTFSISNLGMYGIRQFQAVINPPQACILAVGASQEQAVVQDGKVVIATVMNATLSVDHRAVDGAVGAEYLQALKRIIEDPLSLLL